ncbi:MAG: GNAT family N-acetyltransferase [Limisphaerales bacterium]
MPASIDMITLRPERPEDEPFLRDVHAGTRQEEMDAVGWPPAVREAFLNSQFSAQVHGYRTAFPKADFQIILSKGRAVGRLVVNRTAEEILLVDIALLPAHRNAGIGTVLMQRLLSEAAASGKPLRLSVIKRQRAFRLYQRLGFKKIGESDLRDDLEWRAGYRGAEPDRGA